VETDDFELIESRQPMKTFAKEQYWIYESTQQSKEEALNNSNKCLSAIIYNCFMVYFLMAHVHPV
jgi:hypothetical protein